MFKSMCIFYIVMSSSMTRNTHKKKIIFVITLIIKNVNFIFNNTEYV